MLGFLIKIATLGAIVAGIGFVITKQTGSLPTPESLKAEVEHTIKNFDTKTVTSNLSASLDSLVTNPESNSPVVLGVKISNESIGKVVDALQGLPPEQIDQIRSVICSFPSPSPSPIQSPIQSP